MPQRRHQHLCEGSGQCLLARRKDSGSPSHHLLVSAVTNMMKNVLSSGEQGSEPTDNSSWTLRGPSPTRATPHTHLATLKQHHPVLQVYANHFALAEVVLEGHRVRNECLFGEPWEWAQKMSRSRTGLKLSPALNPQGCSWPQLARWVYPGVHSVLKCPSGPQKNPSFL